MKCQNQIIMLDSNLESLNVKSHQQFPFRNWRQNISITSTVVAIVAVAFDPNFFPHCIAHYPILDAYFMCMRCIFSVQCSMLNVQCVVCFHGELNFSVHTNTPNNIRKKVFWFAIDEILWDWFFKAITWKPFHYYYFFRKKKTRKYTVWLQMYKSVRYVIIRHLNENLPPNTIIVGKVNFWRSNDSFVLQMDFELDKTSDPTALHDNNRVRV